MQCSGEPGVEALLGAPCSAPWNPREPELLASLRHSEACWWARASSTREQFRKVGGGGTPFKYWRCGRLPGGGSKKQEAELEQTEEAGGEAKAKACGWEEPEVGSTVQESRWDEAVTDCQPG